jgi:hypothetical protein
VRFRDERDELILRSVRVLEFVDEDVPKSALDRVPNRRRLANEFQRKRDLIAEVDESIRAEQLLVTAVRSRQLQLPCGALSGDLGPVRGLGTGGLGTRRLGCACGRRAKCRCLDDESLRMGDVCIGRDVLVFAPAEQRGQGRQESGRVPKRPVFVEVEVKEMFAQEDDDFWSRQDTDIDRQAQLERVFPDQTIAEGVEGADRRLGVAIRDELIDPDLHLIGRLVRKGQREDLGRFGPSRRDQPRDSPGDDLCLAGTCAGDDEQRPLPVRDRAQLLRIETAKQSVETRRSVAALVDLGRVNEAIPDR